MVDVESITIPPEVLALIPGPTAARWCVMPLSLDDDGVCVAVPENCGRQVIQDLHFLLGRKMKPEPMPRERIEAAIMRQYGIDELEARRIRRSAAEHHSRIEGVESSRLGESSLAEGNGDSSAIALADRMIAEGISLGASDMHVEPHEHVMRIRYRVDGVLHEALRLPPERARSLISRLKVMAELDIAEKRRPQDGRMRVRKGGSVVDIRVSSLPTDFGEKIVLRILDKSRLQLDLAGLGFEEEELGLFRRTLALPYGMILVTGPTGSGKTTTLYAALNSLNNPTLNITTIEDPIEYNLPGITQTRVRTEIGVTFASALRSILRQDPDVIMVGEIRDTETAEIAIRAALTGHLVFSTLHTNDASSSIVRLIDMGIEPFLVASSVRMILAQRLLRKLCKSCKRRSRPTAGQREELGLRESLPPFHAPAGCQTCHQTGYSGRTAVYEVLRVQEDIGSMIARGAPVTDIRKAAQTCGMKTLRHAALGKAANGQTSLEEVLRETTC